MFIIDFGNKYVSKYHFSVIGNSNVDIVNFYSHFTQYASDCSIYLKIRSNDDNYVDKIAIASENISVDDNALLVKWTMGLVSTQCKELDLQLQFEKEGDIIAQTGIVSLVLSDTIDVDKLIPPIYPQVLKLLQEQIDELKLESVKSINASWNDKTLNILLKNKNSETITSVQVDFSLYAKIVDVPKSQTNISIIVNPLTNLNGRVLSNFEASLNVQGKFYHITRGGNNLDIEQAKNYIEFMSGTRYLPVYEYEKPVNSFWLMADGTFLKPQYSADVGINLYIMESPFALKTDLENKVSKTHNPFRVYVTDEEGIQETAPIDNHNGSVVRRNSNNDDNITVPAIPVGTNSATPKGYVDTHFANSIVMNIDSSTYILTLELVNYDGDILATQTIDLPLESMVVGGSYDDNTKSLILTLKNGQTITIPVSDLISGLVDTSSLIASNQDIQDIIYGEGE